MTTKITKENYDHYAPRIDWQKMPESARSGKQKVDKFGLEKMRDASVDTYLKLINVKIAKDPSILKEAGHSKAMPSAEKKDRAHASEKPKRTRTKKTTEAKPKAEPKAAKLPVLPPGTPVTMLANDVAFVKRFVALHGKQKSREGRGGILGLLHSLQRGILEGRIRKGDTNDDAITKMQESLIKIVNTMPREGKILFEINEKVLPYYQAIASGTHQRKSVTLLKTYIALTGKQNVKTKTANLLKNINKWLQVIPSSDIFHGALVDAQKALEKFVGNTNAKVLELDNWQLSGIGNASVGKDIAGLGRITNTKMGRVAARLVDANVKNLGTPELRRAFKDTKAPALCMEVAKRMIKSGDLNIAILRNPAALDKLAVKASSNATAKKKIRKKKPQATA